MEDNDAVAALSALAHPSRLQAFRALVGAGPEGMTPGLLAEQMDVPPATLSFHLKELLHAGLVSVERQGRSLIYRAEFARTGALVDYLTAHCCQGQACAPIARPARPVRSSRSARAC